LNAARSKSETGKHVVYLYSDAVLQIYRLIDVVCLILTKTEL